MRKLLLLFIVSAMALGCSKNNDVYSGTNELVYIDNDKVGKIVWGSKNEDRSSLLGFEKIETETIMIFFESNRECSVHYYKEDNISSGYIQEEHLKGTYTYNYPIIKIKTENGKEEKFIINEARDRLTDDYGHIFKK